MLNLSLEPFSMVGSIPKVSRQSFTLEVNLLSYLIHPLCTLCWVILKELLKTLFLTLVCDNVVLHWSVESLIGSNASLSWSCTNCFAFAYVVVLKRRRLYRKCYLLAPFDALNKLPLQKLIYTKLSTLHSWSSSIILSRQARNPTRFAIYYANLPVETWYTVPV